MGHAHLPYRGSQPCTLIDIARFSRIYELLDSVLDLEGDIVELGVCRGGIAAGMAMIAPWKTRHLFDTFEGLPKTPFEEIHRPGGFSDTSVEAVRNIFSKQANLEIHAGRFPDSLSDAVRQRSFCFAHIDGDYYETTRDALDFFYPRLTSRGVMAFEDWEWVGCPGVKKSLLEAREAFGTIRAILRVGRL